MMEYALSSINNMKYHLEKLTELLNKDNVNDLLSIYEYVDLRDLVFTHSDIEYDLTNKIVELVNVSLPSPFLLTADTVVNSKYFLLMKDGSPFGKIHKATKRLFLNNTFKEREGLINYNIRFNTLGHPKMKKDIQELKEKLQKYYKKRFKTKKVNKLIAKTEIDLEKYEKFYLHSVKKVKQLTLDKDLLQNEISEFNSLLKVLHSFGFYCNELYDNEHYIYFHHYFKENQSLLNGQEIILNDYNIGFYENAPIPKSSQYSYRQVLLGSSLYRTVLNCMDRIKIIDVELYKDSAENEEFNQYKKDIYQAIQLENQEILVRLLKNPYYTDDNDILKLTFIYKGVYFKVSNIGHIITHTNGFSLINEKEDVFNYVFGFKL